MNTYEFDTVAFELAVKGSPLEPVAAQLANSIQAQGHALKHGHLPRWQAALERLPQLGSVPTHPYTINDGVVSLSPTLSAEQHENVVLAFKDLMPWRKGPFQIADINIDTEWRSDWKWDRLAPHISSLAGKTVLDVGCGSGYHLWRMHAAGATTVLGIDPSLLFVQQFAAIQHFAAQPGIHLLPLSMEALPANLHLFDTVFSMGVLYHRRDPLEHLRALKAAMSATGELVMETLVIPGTGDDALAIDGRYANMRNLYELPTVARLCQWLIDAGLQNPRVVDVTVTQCSEQRSTPWMTSHSLQQALHPDDESKTIEGHPRPLRAIVLAKY